MDPIIRVAELKYEEMFIVKKINVSFLLPDSTVERCFSTDDLARLKKQAEVHFDGSSMDSFEAMATAVSEAHVVVTGWGSKKFSNEAKK